MKSLENLAEDLRKQLFLLDESKLEPSMSDKDFLFIPRKKLKVKRLGNGSWQTRSWFIDKRLNSYATVLDQPTRVSNDALTSGCRSGIILDDNENYLRLKGIRTIDSLNGNSKKP